MEREQEGNVIGKLCIEEAVITSPDIAELPLPKKEMRG